jgi:hypothetical protein
VPTIPTPADDLKAPPPGAPTGAARGPGGPPLGTYGDSATPPLHREERRASRHQIKVAQRRLTTSVSSRLCWYAAAAQVAIDVGAQGIAHVSGIRRCGSSWACPVCAPVIRERRAVEVDTGLRTHLERGGGALFLTLTLQHHRGDTLASRLDVIASSIHDVLKGSAWDRRRQALGYVGTIKAVEVTWGEANGWHPHSHSVLLFDRPITDDERLDLLRWITQRWTHLAETKNLGTISQQHGVDLKAVTDGEGIGRYVTKVEGGWTAGHELARGDRKSNAPLQLLQNLVATGEKRWALLWQEYEAATYGKKSLRWSAGLRAHLLGVEDDQADADLAASEGVDLTLLRALVDAADWNRVVKAGATARLLDEVERGAALLLGLWAILGGNPQPLDVSAGARGQRGVGRSPTGAGLRGP